MMMRTIVAFLCIGLVSAGGSRPTASQLIDKFKAVLPGAFPQGLQDNIESASNLVKDVGRAEVTKEELEEAKRVLKLTLVANIAQRKQEQDDLMDEEEFMRTSEAEIANTEKEVESFVENLVKTGAVRVVEEKSAAAETPVYKEVMADRKENEEAAKTSGLVSKGHKNSQRTEVDPNANVPFDIVEFAGGVENLHLLEEVEKRPDLLPGGSSYVANQKKAKKERELRAMARRWRQDPRPTGRLTSGDVLENKDSIVHEIFKAYDHNNDNNLNLAEFNELQADTDGPDSVNTAEEYSDLLKQVGAATADKLHFVTFKELYLDPWKSEKFETILPVDYHALLEAGKVKGEAMADTWFMQEEDAKLEKEIEPIIKEDMEEEQKAMAAIEGDTKLKK